MGRVVVLSTGLLMLLCAAPFVVISAASAGSAALTAAAGAGTALVVVLLLRLWTAPARRARGRPSGRLLHRGATKSDYDPWVGGGVG